MRSPSCSSSATRLVIDLSRRGVLPAFKIGKHWRYRRADLEEWMIRRHDQRRQRLG
ncbi:MAG: helix-turn-helix domain-containing protein [Solirubrobacteraceae bacterium]